MIFAPRSSSPRNDRKCQVLLPIWKHAKLFEMIGLILILVSAAWWGRTVNYHKDELDAIDRELLLASVSAVQDDVLRASTWLSGDKPEFERDLDIIYGRIETLRKAKDEIKDERKSTAALDRLRFAMFAIGSILIAVAKFLEWKKETSP